MIVLWITLVLCGIVHSVEDDLCGFCSCGPVSYSSFYKTEVDCSNRNISDISEIFKRFPSKSIRGLNLSNNRLTAIKPGSFQRFGSITKLLLSNNQIHTIEQGAFRGLKKLRVLNLRNNQLVQVPTAALFELKKIQQLDLEQNFLNRIRRDAFVSNRNLNSLLLGANRIKNISRRAFRNLPRLETLSLRDNYLHEVPTLALRRLSNPFDLDLDLNNIHELQNGSFHRVNASIVEVLKQKTIDKVTVHKKAFSDMPFLRRLSLLPARVVEFPDLPNTNRLQYLEIANLENLHIPERFCDTKPELVKLSILHSSMNDMPLLSKCYSLSELNLAQVSVQKISSSALSGLQNLRDLHMILRKDAIEYVDEHAFSNLPALGRLDLSHLKLSAFPNLTGTTALEELDLSDCSIQSIPEQFCDGRQMHLKKLALSSNSIQDLPDLSTCKELRHVELEHNIIRSVDGKLEGLSNLLFLRLSHNNIVSIGNGSFAELDALVDLYLDNNMIEYIHPGAFQDCSSLTELDVSYNRLKRFPSAGLQSLLVVNAKGNRDMITFATQEDLPHVKKLTLDYAYHCCYFRAKVEQIQTNYDLNVQAHKMDSWQYRVLSDKSQHRKNSGKLSNMTRGGVLSSQDLEPLLRDMNNHTEIYFHRPEGMPNPEWAEVSSAFHDSNDDSVAYCTPTPNEFYPCEDLIGRQWLRICAWVVFLLALLGNLTVLFILTANCAKLDVPRYLIINLAFADLCLGIYLGFLVFVDLKTLGDFRAHALKWQFSDSCRAAGFVAIFSSELSVYTLTVITIERYITIKNSFRTTKRMNKRHAVTVMGVGWLFSFIMATLPLFNSAVKFSDYTKYSVCLPFDTDGAASKAYLIFLLLFNLVAFSVILVCYIMLYLSIRGSNAWHSGDSRAARRMAVLVMTDFVCWFPIAMLALSAVFQKSLITDLWISKVFTVFIFPLNACANPFLYTICSRQFRKDCAAIIRQVKETSSRQGGLRKSLVRLPVKGSLTYSTSVRRGSSCSFLFGRRSSSRHDEIRANSRTAATSLKIPLNTDDDSRDETAEYNEILTSL